MKKIEGIASEVTNTTSVSGGNDTAVTTTHITTLKLNGEMVQVMLGTPPIINEGDQIAVAGMVKDGILIGCAYKNITKNVLGSTPHLMSLIIGVVFSMVAFAPLLMGFIVFKDDFFGVFPKIIGVILFISFIIAGVKLVKTGLVLKKAKSLIYS